MAPASAVTAGVGAILPSQGLRMCSRASVQGALLASVAQASNRDRTAIKLPPTASFSLAQLVALGIREGTKLIRVRLDQVLAVASAGNSVEFVLTDGRRLLMRSPLSALEKELGPRGFLRTHRSWLVNAGRMMALRPEGSGDYAVELGRVMVPLSRRFPQALAKLRGGQGRDAANSRSRHGSRRARAHHGSVMEPPRTTLKRAHLTRNTHGALQRGAAPGT